MQCTLIPIVLCFLALSTAAPAESPSWPRWRGPDGNGISRETGWNPAALNGGAKVLWTADVGTGYSNVVIQDSRLYTMGVTKDGLAFSCLDAVSGMPIWTKSPFSSLEDPQSTPVIDGDKVYGLGKDGTVFCLRTADGELVWKKNLVKDFKAPNQSYGWASSPVVDGNLLLLNALSAGIALDKRTGDPVWKSDSFWVGGAGYYASPVIGDFKGTRCVLFYGPVELCAVEIATGKKLWSWKQFYPSDTLADPVLSDNKVMIRGIADIQIDMGGGESRNVWVKMIPGGTMCTPVPVNGYLYFSRTTQGFGDLDWVTFLKVDWFCRSVDWRTGEVMWEKPMKYPSLIAADGKLIILESNGTLRIAEANPAAYREISSADVLAGANRPRRFVTTPVLCAGLIYCRNYAGDLVCVDVRK